LKIGLTGDIGSGKSTVLGLFGSMGFQTISADAIVHELLAADDAVIAKICGAFGDDLLTPGSGIDRQKLGSRIFGKKQARLELEGILHPRVREKWESFCQKHEAENAVVEIPLLFEKNLENSFDHSVSVYSSLEVKTERLKKRGMVEADIRKRLDAQLDQESKANRSDFLILNNGSLDFLRRQVSECVSFLKQS